MTRHIENLASDIESSLKKHISKIIYYSMAFDESTDMMDTAQFYLGY